LHGDACGIVDLDPDAAQAGSTRAIDLLGNEALGPKLARMGEHGRPILEDGRQRGHPSPGMGDCADPHQHVRSALRKSTRGWLIALMALCCDPMAITLPRLRHGDQSPLKTIFGP
jgi:hypothetical protein